MLQTIWNQKAQHVSLILAIYWWYFAIFNVKIDSKASWNRSGQQNSKKRTRHALEMPSKSHLNRQERFLGHEEPVNLTELGTESAMKKTDGTIRKSAMRNENEMKET